MLSNKKPAIEKVLAPLVGKLSWINPNLLTLLGSIPPLLFFVFVINKMYVWAIIALALGAVDVLDGMVARKFGKVTSFGGFLDSFIDRIGDFFFITSFAFAGIVRWEIIAPLLLFSFLTSYARSRGGLAAKSHDEFAVGLIERPERLVLIFVGLLSLIFLPGAIMAGISATEWIFLILALLSLVTVIQRVLHAYKKL